MQYFPFIAKHFLYIVIIMLCTVTATLYISRSNKKNLPLCTTITVFLIAILIYTVFEMFFASFYSTVISNGGHFVVCVMSDIVFFVIVISWVRLLLLLSGSPYMINAKGITIYTSVYAVIVEGIAVVSAFIKTALPQQTFNMVIVVCDGIFDTTILIISLVFLFYSLFIMREDENRLVMCILSLTLAVYMVYVLYWDIRSKTIDEGTFSKYQEFDPLPIAYVILCVIIIWQLKSNSDRIFGFDISRLIDLESAHVTEWERLSEKFRLTVREIEVAQLVCQGMSNVEIAEKLFISESTVKHHLGSVYKKTKLKTRYELMNAVKMQE